MASQLLPRVKLLKKDDLYLQQVIASELVQVLPSQLVESLAEIKSPVNLVDAFPPHTTKSPAFLPHIEFKVGVLVLVMVEHLAPGTIGAAVQLHCLLTARRLRSPQTSLQVKASWSQVLSFFLPFLHSQ